MSINNKKEEISHDGRVVEIAEDKYRVKIISPSACAGCHARGVCSASDSAEKFIDTFSVEALEVGDKVKVIMEERLGGIAIFYAYFLPFLVMMVCLVAMIALGAGEITAALFAIGSLVPYYAGLYLFRDRAAREFVFRAEKINILERGVS